MELNSLPKIEYLDK